MDAVFMRTVRGLAAAHFGTALLVVAWFLLAALDFPPPRVDDLCYVAPAVEVAGGHGPMNPWSTYFLEKFGGYSCYPPFYADLLGGWLKGFGVSTPALLFFQALCGAVATLSLSFWRRRWGLPFWTEIVAWFLFVVLAAPRGLRPDLCGLALFGAGASLEAGRGRIGREAGPLLLLGSCGTLPILAGPVAALFLCRLAEAVRASGRAWFPLALRWVAAGGVVGFLLLAGIGFAPRSFWDRFVENAKDTTSLIGSVYFSNVFHSPGIFLRLVLVPGLAVVCGALLAASAWRGRHPGEGRWLVLRWGGLTALFVLMVRGVGVSSSGLPFLDLASGLGIVAAAGWAWNRGWRLAGTGTALGACLLVAAGYWEIFGWAVARKPSPQAIASIRRKIEATRPDFVLIDVYAYRYLYDYRLPPNARDFFFSVPSYPEWKRKSPEARNGETRVWVVSVFALDYLKVIQGFDDDPRMEPLRLFGRTVPHFFHNGNDLLLFR